MRRLRGIGWFVLAALVAVSSVPAATVASAGPEPAVPVLAQTQPGCHPNYAGTCIPVDVADADCAGTEDGPHYVEEKNIVIIGGDPFGLDPDNDGFGCDDPPEGPGTAGAGQPTTTMVPPDTTTTTSTTTTTTTSVATPPPDVPVTGANTERQVVAAAALVVLGACLLVLGRNEPGFGMG